MFLLPEGKEGVLRIKRRNYRARPGLPQVCIENRYLWNTERAGSCNISEKKTSGYWSVCVWRLHLVVSKTTPIFAYSPRITRRGGDKVLTISSHDSALVLNTPHQLPSEGFRLEKRKTTPWGLFSLAFSPLSGFGFSQGWSPFYSTIEGGEGRPDVSSIDAHLIHGRAVSCEVACGWIRYWWNMEHAIEIEWRIKWGDTKCLLGRSSSSSKFKMDNIFPQEQRVWQALLQNTLQSCDQPKNIFCLLRIGFIWW